MKKRMMYIRYFKYPDCGSITTATKPQSRRTPDGHIKDLYYYKCKKITHTVQVSQ